MHILIKVMSIGGLGLKSTLPEKQIKKITAQGAFIHCHPWRSPFGPAKAALLYSLKIRGKVDSNLKPC
jgi:hypothetical protein